MIIRTFGETLSPSLFLIYLSVIAALFAIRGVPENIRSDNGSEFTTKAVREWLAHVGVKTDYIEPGSPWRNGGLTLTIINSLCYNVEIIKYVFRI